MADLIGTDSILWIAFAAQFFAIEFKALFNKEKGDTWSEVLRYIFGFSKRQTDQGWSMRARRGSFWAMAIWFTGHIAFGW